MTCIGNPMLRTDGRTDGHVTITSLPKFLGLIGYQISLAMELRWRASALAPLKSHLLCFLRSVLSSYCKVHFSHFLFHICSKYCRNFKYPHAHKLPSTVIHFRQCLKHAKAVLLLTAQQNGQKKETTMPTAFYTLFPRNVTSFTVLNAIW